MIKSYKYRIYPTVKQRDFIDKHINCNRFIYNLALETKLMAYSTNKHNLTCFDLMKQLTELKKEYIWLKEVDSQVLQQSIIDLDSAFNSFFKGLSEFPKFKTKKNPKNSFRNPRGNNISIKNNKLIIPKFREGIKIIIDRLYEGAIKSVTISKTNTGKYFASILCNVEEIIKYSPLVANETSIGIDLGLRDFIITSNGQKIKNPKYLKNNIDRLKKLQKRNSRKIKGSNNQIKFNKKIAIIYEKITNQRKDFLHKLSTNIIKNHDTICVESLAIHEMVKNKKLSREIYDASWGRFIDMLEYKANWYGKNILKIPRFEPSTKLCSNCGKINHNLTLNDREWKCSCGILHDRDINAAKNIKNFCITKFTPKDFREVPVEMLTLVKSKKQEIDN